ncbi:MAG: hypothetical protein AAF682_27980, partial [Planctomycetota bacterium]
GGAALRLTVRAVAPGAAGSPRLRADVGRDGWRARATFDPAGLDPGTLGMLGASARRWLLAPSERGGAGVPLVLAFPGGVDVGLAALEPPAGDPAAFALSWAQLLDGAALPHPDVVALAVRRAAGEPSVRGPELPEERSDENARATRWPLDAWLAGLAAFVALIALALER